MEPKPEEQVYQFKIHIVGISPQIWRRVLVKSDSTVHDLHRVIQLVFDWDNYHLHLFRIHAVEFGDGGGACGDVRKQLWKFKLRLRERFIYEYDFGDCWQHEVRLEKILPVVPKSFYPRCISGKRATPPEDCGGPQVYMVVQYRLLLRVLTGWDEDDFCDDDLAFFAEHCEDFNPEEFDKAAANRELATIIGPELIKN